MGNSNNLKIRQGNPKVLLVSMPWTTQSEPGLGLGLLRAVLDQQGIPCRVLHLNLFLLEHLHAYTYEALSRAHSLNDFLFSGTLDPVVTNLQLRWLRQKAVKLLADRLVAPHWNGGVEGAVSTLLRIRGEIIPQWLNRWADEIAGYDASLVGFTCMFDQTIASLALSKMVRERAPDKMLALGGYAVRTPTAEMILRSCPWIDTVCNGEGEITIGELARAAVGNIILEDVHGILLRSASGEVVATQSSPIANLDANPVPNFDDFFADTRRMSEEFMVDVTPIDLPVENSRGCWWGAKSHCVFCGIRDDDMVYRARDYRTVLDHMAILRQRYNLNYFHFTDYILPYRYFETLMPELVKLGQPYRLSAEIKANITEKRFLLLAQAGFKEIQPGIESFDSGVLRKMGKGVSAMQNIHLLLMGRKYTVTVLYNILYGFPGDEPEEYQRISEILPRLFHLDPPVTCVPVQITRYAPLQMQPGSFGIENSQMEPGYELIFSRQYLIDSGFDLEDYCYYFERSFENSVKLQQLYEQIDKIVRVWQELHLTKKSWLYAEEYAGSEGILIRDCRGNDEIVHYLDGADAEVLLACAQPVSLSVLLAGSFINVEPHSVASVVDRLELLGLIFREDQQVISLVLPGMSYPEQIKGQEEE